jgi:hypothetical protein
MTGMLPRWLSASELARYLSMSRTTVKKLEDAGLLPTATGPSPRLLRYDRHAVDDAMRQALAARVGEAEGFEDIDAVSKRIANGLAQGNSGRP